MIGYCIRVFHLIVCPLFITQLKISSLILHTLIQRISAVRSNLNIPLDSFVLLYVGRLVASKGIFRIQQELDTLLTQYNDICLVYVSREDTECVDDLRQLNDLKPYRYQILS